MDQRIKQKGNNIFLTKWQWKYKHWKLWDTAKAILWEKIIALDADSTEDRKIKINHPIFHLKNLVDMF